MYEKSLGEKIKNAQNHLKCPEEWCLRIFRKIHILHYILIAFIFCPGYDYRTMYYYTQPQHTKHFQNIGI